MNLMSEHEIHTIGGDESFTPHVLQYMWNLNLAGERRTQIDASVFVSSPDELIAAIRRQTNYFQTKPQPEHPKGVLTSALINKKLGIEVDEREQLEGVLSLTLGRNNYLFNFNNHTIEILPEGNVQ